MEMKIKKPVVVHPFLFALYVVLFLYARNVDKVALSTTVMPTIVVLLSVSLLLFLLKQMLHDLHSAGIIVSVVLLWFFSYEAIYSVVAGFEIAGFVLGRHRYLTPIYPVLLLSFLFIFNLLAVRKKTIGIHKITNYLNVVSVLLILFPLIGIGTYYVRFKTYKIKTDIVSEPIVQKAKSVNVLEHDELKSLPDIYYIILDSYTGERALKKYFGFDNSKFINSLTDKGFYVASKSRTNYSTTTLSIPSTLNMQYHLNDIPDFKSGDETIAYQMVENNKMLRFLKSKGYHYINLSIWEELDNKDDYENRYKYKSFFNEFNIELLRISVLQQIVVVPYIDISEKSKNTIHIFEQLKKIPDIKESTFTYAHIMSPHPPYAFDRDGEKVGDSFFSQLKYIWTEKERYLDEIIFVNKQIEMVVDKILSTSDVQPIIIIQGDHGAVTMRDFGVEDNRQIRMSILNAYYLSDNGSSVLYDSISPVNSFRLICDYYFGTNYGLLEDKSYYSHGIGFKELIQVHDSL